LSGTSPRPRRAGVWLGLAVAAAWLLCFGRSPGHDFVWDDVHFARADSLFQGPLAPVLRATQWELIEPERFRDDVRPHGSYRPLTNALLWLELRLAGPSPFWLHAFGLLLGLGLVASVLALAARILGSPGWGLGVAALFAFHPVAVEAFCYASAQGDLLAAAFLVLATWAYLRAQDPDAAGSLRFAALCPVFFALSLLSKEAFLLLPLALCALAPSARELGSPRRLYPIAACAAVAVAFASFHRAYVPGSDPKYDLGGLVIAPGVVAQAFGAVLWPADTGISRPFVAAWIPVGLVGLAALGVARVRLRGPAREPLGLAIWAVLSIATSAPTVFRTGVLSDRYLLAPLLGALLVAGVLARRRLGPRPPAWAAAACLVLLLALGARSAREVGAWRDEVALFGHALRAAPESPDALHKAAELEIRAGDAAAARPLLERALRVHPHHVRSLLLLAQIERSEGDLGAASGLLERALRVDPYHPLLLVEGIRVASTAGDRETACARSWLLRLTLLESWTADLWDENCRDLEDALAEGRVRPFRPSDALSADFWRMWLP